MGDSSRLLAIFLLIRPNVLEDMKIPRFLYCIGCASVFGLVLITFWSSCVASECKMEGSGKLRKVFTFPEDGFQVFSYEARFSIDGIETKTWHQVCSINRTRKDCPKSTFGPPDPFLSRTCFCSIDIGSSLHYVKIQLVYNRLISKTRVRFTAGDRDFREHTTGSYPMPEVQPALDETLLVNDNDAKLCDIEVAENSNNRLQYCVPNIAPPYETSVKIPTREFKGQQVCWVVQLDMSDPGISFDSMITLKAQETESCKRGTSHGCRLRKIAPLRLALLKFDQQNSQFPCESGVVLGSYFYFKGSVNYTGVDLKERPLKIEVQLDSPMGTFITIHSIDILAEGCDDRQRANSAYCLRQDSVNEIYHLIINKTSEKSLNGRRLRLWWPIASDGEASISQAVPVGKKTVTPTLTFGGISIDMSGPSWQWSLPLVREKMVSIKFCLTNMTIPYIIEMHAKPSESRGIHTWPCLEAEFYDSCETRLEDFEFEYFQHYGCFKRKSFRFARTGIVKTGGKFHVLRDAISACPAVLQEVNEVGMVFNALNVAKPLTITAYNGLEEVKTVSDNRIEIHNVTGPGLMSFVVSEDSCQLSKNFSCVLLLKKTQAPACIIPSLGLDIPITSLAVEGDDNFTYFLDDLQESCNMVLDEYHQYSFQFCFSNQRPMYQVEINVNTSGALLTQTNSCVTFSHEPRGKTFRKTYAFKVVDACEDEREYLCTVDFNLAPPVEDKVFEKNFTILSAGITFALLLLVAALTTLLVLKMCRKEEQFRETKDQPEEEAAISEEESIIESESESSITSQGTSVDTRSYTSR